MALSWRYAQVPSPWGPIRTAHWTAEGGSDSESDKAASDSDSDFDLHLPTAPSEEVKKPKKNKRRQLERAEDVTTTVGQLQAPVEDCDHLGSAEDELGAVLWNGNTVALHALAAWLRPHAGRRVKVLELGAGVGCLGVALARAGADVCITDVPRLLPLMQHNVEANAGTRLPSAPSSSVSAASAAAPQFACARGEGGPIKSVACGRGMIGAASLKWGDPVSQSLLDWWRDVDVVTSAGPPLRIVVLCDALYGNPVGWPGLTRLLHWLCDAIPSSGEKKGKGADDAPSVLSAVRIVNFCEQRVSGVENAYLDMLAAERRTAAYAAAVAAEAAAPTSDCRVAAQLPADAIDSTGTVATHTPAEPPSPTPMGADGASGDAAAGAVDAQGGSAWVVDMGVLSRRSEMKMPVRMTLVRRVVRAALAAPRPTPEEQMTLDEAKRAAKKGGGGGGGGNAAAGPKKGGAQPQQQKQQQQPHQNKSGARSGNQQHGKGAALKPPQQQQQQQPHQQKQQQQKQRQQKQNPNGTVAHKGRPQGGPKGEAGQRRQRDD